MRFCSDIIIVFLRLTQTLCASPAVDICLFQSSQYLRSICFHLLLSQSIYILELDFHSVFQKLTASEFRLYNSFLNIYLNISTDIKLISLFLLFVASKAGILFAHFSNECLVCGRYRRGSHVLKNHVSEYPFWSCTLYIK